MSTFTYRLVAEQIAGMPRRDDRRTERLLAAGWEPVPDDQWPVQEGLDDPEILANLRRGGFSLWRQDQDNYDRRMLEQAAANEVRGDPRTQIAIANKSIRDYASTLGRPDALRGWTPIGGAGHVTSGFRISVAPLSRPWLADAP